MLVTTESKAQGWRAVAVFDDRGDALLVVGRSSTQVRQLYPDAFAEVLDEEEREHVSTIQLQQWSGAPDAGRCRGADLFLVPAGNAGTERLRPRLTDG